MSRTTPRTGRNKTRNNLLLALCAALLVFCLPRSVWAEAPSGGDNLLTFREGCELDTAGRPAGVTADVVILDSGQLQSVEVRTQTDAVGQDLLVIQLIFTGEGAEIFAQATTRLTGQQISIWLGEELLSAPYVQGPILDGEAVITGGLTQGETEALAARIRQGMSGTDSAPSAVEGGDRSPRANRLGPFLLSRPGSCMVAVGVFALLLLFFV